MRRPLVAAFDLVICLLLIFVILALISSRAAPAIPTYGSYAVTATWAIGSNDDVDLYVRDPAGNIAWFANTNAGLMNLEHDDLGTTVSGTETLADGRQVRVLFNGERTVIRGVTPGEYTVNLHMYSKNDPGPTVVTVILWSLRGADRALHTVRVTLGSLGEEQTAFRFDLNAAGELTSTNRLPAHFVGGARPEVSAAG